MRSTALKLLPDNFPDAGHKAKADEYWTLHARPDLSRRLEDIVAEFRAHHEAKGTRFCNWAAGWKTWYVRCVRFIEPPKSKDKYKGFSETGRRGRIYVAPTKEEIECVSLQKVREVAEKLRSTAQKRLWT